MHSPLVQIDKEHLQDFKVLFKTLEECLKQRYGFQRHRLRKCAWWIQVSTKICFLN